MTGFKKGDIEGILVKSLEVFKDERGWLTELFREDELSEGLHLPMCYLSLTYPGVVRGPHEHREQTDYFCFFGEFHLYLWDNRRGSPTYRNHKIIEDTEKKTVIVPPGVVHAYKNAGKGEGFVLNFPDRLFRGWGKEDEVDEIRYENDPGSPFKL